MIPTLLATLGEENATTCDASAATYLHWEGGPHPKAFAAQDIAQGAPGGGGEGHRMGDQAEEGAGCCSSDLTAGTKRGSVAGCKLVCAPHAQH